MAEDTHEVGLDTRRGEFAWIAKWADRARSTKALGVRESIGDDAAVLAYNAREDLLVTTDLCVDGVHFRRDWMSTEECGRASMTANLSDIAAMGGEPWVALVGLAIGADWTASEVDALFAGLLDEAAPLGVEIVGGDTSSASAGGTTVAITVLGRVAKGRAWLRSGARVGDIVCVTGALGETALGYRLLEQRGPASVAADLTERFRRPRARGVMVREARQQRLNAHACIDLSDGLSSDAAHVAVASGVTLALSSSAIPIAERARVHAGEVGATALELALGSGGEYELLLTMSPRAVARWTSLCARCGVALTPIGRVEACSDGAAGVTLDGKPLPATGWSHF